MTGEPLTGGTITAIVALVGWVWRLSNTVTTHSVQLGLCLPQLEKGEARFERLETGAVRSETTLEHLSGQMATLTAQLQPLPGIAASLQNIANDVAELKQQQIPREVIEAKFKALENK